MFSLFLTERGVSDQNFAFNFLSVGWRAWQKQSHNYILIKNNEVGREFYCLIVPKCWSTFLHHTISTGEREEQENAEEERDRNKRTASDNQQHFHELQSVRFDGAKLSLHFRALTANAVSWNQLWVTTTECWLSIPLGLGNSRRISQSRGSVSPSCLLCSCTYVI